MGASAGKQAGVGKPNGGAARHGSDTYARLMHAPVLGGIARRAGLPRPVAVERRRPGAAVVEGTVLLGAADPVGLAPPAAACLLAIGANTAALGGDAVHRVAQDVGLDCTVATPGGDQRFKALVFDASGIADSTRLVELHRFFQPVVRQLGSNGRVVVLGRPPASVGEPRASAAQRALEGFTRALGKELGRRGATVQLVYVAGGAEQGLESTMRFLLSPRSAYVSGQVIRLDPHPQLADGAAGVDWERPLAGRTALVTGAARGIGAAIAEVLAADGADVVGLDVAAAQADLRALMERIGGQELELDITSADAPATLAGRFQSGLDVLVHNAGVTRDRTLAKMPEERWATLMDIDLSSQERINEELLARRVLRANGRIVCVSSIAGIAGNAGQTNYSTAKAGVIGVVEALAGKVAGEHGATINAVAPGFIETQMTAAMPFAIREAGRRMNSLLQGGHPVDVAETIAWLAAPPSAAVNGNVIRVCGQSLLGA